MSKHTPGPWDIINQYIIAADESVICQWESYTDEANARLIAAAPDLLAALKQIIPFASGLSGHSYVLAEARAAIAKAEGCCQFHASGGDKSLSCGGDIAKAEGTS